MAGSGSAREAGAVVALAGGCIALVAVIVRALVMSYEHQVWLTQFVRREPPGGFQGQLAATTVAFAAGPILLIYFGRLLWDDHPLARRDWGSSSGSLMAVGAAAGSWFIALGLRAPRTHAFLIEGTVLTCLGVLAGALGLVGLARSRRRLLLEAASQNWSHPMRLLRGALILGCFASLAMMAIVFGWRAHSPEGLDKAVLLAEMLPALILASSLIPALVDSKSLQKWEVVGGAWLGAGVALGLVYLSVGVVYLPNAASIGLFVCYCLLAAAGHSILRNTSDVVVAVELAGFDHPPRTIHHNHPTPLSGQLSLHLRNLHGVVSVEVPSSEAEAVLLHDQLHAVEEALRGPTEGSDA